MVYKLDPLDISLDFERRPYRLGRHDKCDRYAYALQQRRNP